MASEQVIPPLTSAGCHVLVAVASGATYGYAIMGFTSELSQGRFELAAGTLYRTLARLVADGLLEERPSGPESDRQRHYRLTTLGRRAVEADLGTAERLVAAGAAAGLLSHRRSA